MDPNCDRKRYWPGEGRKDTQMGNSTNEGKNARLRRREALKAERDKRAKGKRRNYAQGHPTRIRFK